MTKKQIKAAKNSDSMIAWLQNQVDMGNGSAAKEFKYPGAGKPRSKRSMGAK